MQYNTLTSFYTGNRASAPGQRSWARQPWHSPMRGNVAPRRQAASWPCCSSLLRTPGSTSSTQHQAAHPAPSTRQHIQCIQHPTPGRASSTRQHNQCIQHIHQWIGQVSARGHPAQRGQAPVVFPPD